MRPVFPYFSDYFALEMRTLARSCTKCDTAEVVKVVFIGADWQAHNWHDWYADRAVGGFSANGPSGPIR